MRAVLPPVHLRGLQATADGVSAVSRTGGRHRQDLPLVDNQADLDGEAQLGDEVKEETPQLLGRRVAQVFVDDEHEDDPREDRRGDAEDELLPKLLLDRVDGGPEGDSRDDGQGVRCVKDARNWASETVEHKDATEKDDGRGDGGEQQGPQQTRGREQMSHAVGCC